MWVMCKCAIATWDWQFSRRPPFSLSFLLSLIYPQSFRILPGILFHGFACVSLVSFPFLSLPFFWNPENESTAIEFQFHTPCQGSGFWVQAFRIEFQRSCCQQSGFWVSLNSPMWNPVGCTYPETNANNHTRSSYDLTASGSIGLYNGDKYWASFSC